MVYWAHMIAVGHRHLKGAAGTMRVVAVQWMYDPGVAVTLISVNISVRTAEEIDTYRMRQCIEHEK